MVSIFSASTVDFDLWTFLWDNLEAAGVIGGYVSISIIGVSLLTAASKGRLEETKPIGPKWAQPIMGAIMGVIPGCGGTIVASSMYKNRKLSFGGLFAAFITTLGEGSFVLLGASDEADVAANLTAFVVVNAVGFIVGVALGYLLDNIGFRANNPPAVSSEAPPTEPNSPSALQKIVEPLGFYLILAMAAFLAPGSIMALWGGGIDAIADLSVWVSVALTITSILYFTANKFSCDDHSCADGKDLKSTLMHSIADIAMVISYVFLGLFIANYIIDVLVGPETFDAWMTSSAFLVVILAAIIGFTPGCGGMIAVAVAFITIPNFPMAALIAAAIATSGDGIFPLLAENKKDGIVISVAGLVVALVVGLLALAMGI